MLAKGAAIASPGTDKALRIARSADGGSEFHDGLVVVAWVMRFDEGLGEFVDFAAHGSFRDGVVRVPSLDSAKNPLDVAIDYGDGLVVGEAGDGGGSVGTDARKLAEILCGGGHDAAVVVDDGLGGFMQHAGAAVVAEAAPKGEHILLVGFGEGLKGRKALEEGGVALDDHGDAGLLEHDFGDPDRVRIIGVPPGEITLAALIPSEEFGSHVGEGLLARPAAVGHGESLSHRTDPSFMGPRCVRSEVRSIDFSKFFIREDILEEIDRKVLIYKGLSLRVWQAIDSARFSPGSMSLDARDSG